MRSWFVVGALALGIMGAAACFVTVDESLADRPSDAGAEADAPADADAMGPDDRACVGFALGNYCGRSLPKYGGNAQDLVRCLGDGRTGTIAPCTSGCVVMPTNRRDICDPCAAAPDGTYCVQQLVSDYNATDVRITCTNAAIVTSGASAPKICPSGCAVMGKLGDCR